MWARTEPSVDPLGAVDVPDLRADAALEVDRPRLTRLVRGGDTARERPPRPLEHRARRRCRVVEAALLALGQLRYAGTVELCGGSDGHAPHSA